MYLYKRFGGESYGWTWDMFQVKTLLIGEIIQML